MSSQPVFCDTNRTHVLMITNHGVHEWNVVPGIPDTGGQNVFVNQFTESLVAQGYRVTIVNRGGYSHPVTGMPQIGVHYHPSGHARIMYLEDGTPAFIRKEDMADQIPLLVADLEARLAADDDSADLIISHYWDAGVLGAALNERADKRIPHVWVPHSLGALKKQNTDPATWEHLRIDERIELERELLGSLDGAVATSSSIRDTFIDAYGYTPQHFLPPCVNESRYRPHDSHECADIWDFLAARSERSAGELQQRRLVTEISRTDNTKRKDVLIRAFARVCRRIPGLVLVIALDETAGAAYDEATALIRELNLERDVIPLGSVWEQLPCLYAITSVYCTPSVMEGFGMSAQEAAATAKPVVASELVPFAVEYLLGEDPDRVVYTDGTQPRELLVGAGGVVVPADDVAGFATALEMLLSNDARRTAMGRRALDITVPYFTWSRRTRDLLEDLDLTPSR